VSIAETQIVVASANKTEGSLLAALLRHTRVGCPTTVAFNLQSAAETIRGCSRCVIVLDGRLCQPPAIEDFLREVKRLDGPHDPERTIIFYSTGLNEPALRSLISETKGSCEVDQTRFNWPMALLQVAEGCLFRGRVRRLLDGLDQEVDENHFPVLPSVTSELLAIGALLREFGDWSADIELKAEHLLDSRKPWSQYGDTPLVRNAQDDGRPGTSKSLRENRRSREMPILGAIIRHHAAGGHERFSIRTCGGHRQNDEASDSESNPLFRCPEGQERADLDAQAS
jgi:hypothetical protein